MVVMKERRPLPSDRVARAVLIRQDSLGFVRRMAQSDCDRLLVALSKTEGLSRGEVVELQDEYYNVDWEFVPERLKE